MYRKRYSMVRHIHNTHLTQTHGHQNISALFIIYLKNNDFGNIA